MNLLNQNDFEYGNIIHFREKQYELIYPMIYNIMEYLESLGYNYDKNKFKIIEHEADSGYRSQQMYSNTSLNIRVDDSNRNFILLNYPKLIDGTYFKIKGVDYIPQLYISDEPITIKKESAILYSLFQPLTIYNKDARVIFLGNNIPISRFLRIYYSEEDVEEICEKILLTDNLQEDEETILTHLSNMFKVKSEFNTIREIFNKLFFDYWTKGLYKKYYGIVDFDLKNIIDLYLKKLEFEGKKSFIDLHYKRLMFLEIYFRPLFDSVGKISKKLVIDKAQPLCINSNIKLISSYFSSKLNNETLYDMVNGYDINLSLKASFKNPKSNNDHLPEEVSSIDPSFKGKICPLTISNKDPGKVISLIPTLNVDPKYGIFDL